MYKLLIIVFVMVLALFITQCAHKDVSEREARQAVMDELREELKNIPDQERVVLLLDVFNSLRKDINELRIAKTKYRDNMYSLNKKYDATYQDFRSLLDAFNQKRKDLQQNVLASYFRMKELTTSEEWKSLAKLEEEALLRGVADTLLDKE